GWYSSRGDGQLRGVHNRPVWFQEDPFGTLFIPMGSYNMGPSDQDVPFGHTSTQKTVSVQAFYMDQTEISNNEYRQFVHYVRDSIARRILCEQEIQEPGPYCIRKNMYDEELDPPVLSWKEPILWGKPEQREVLADMHLPDHEMYYGRNSTKRKIDTRKLMFDYYWIDLEQAANSKEGLEEKNPANKKGQLHSIKMHSDKSKFIIKEKTNVYPDTLVWVRDFTYSFNDPMTNNYFWHPAYDNYPVVGITWGQAKAFNVWRSRLMNTYRRKVGITHIANFRLPTEAEWEYAARGDLKNSPYPWGGPYIRNRTGCFLGNFKPMRGDYTVDGGFHTVHIFSYSPNDFGLYNMAGNVAEWCRDAFDEQAYDFTHDLNPYYNYQAKENDPPALKRKVIRGGSWKDIGYYLQTGSRSYEYKDS
ncbi:MAG: SUMF1/EgtB/PvdO family nonheme iron enzyme, partial [Flavobacteriales bacterium]